MKLKQLSKKIFCKRREFLSSLLIAVISFSFVIPTPYVYSQNTTAQPVFGLPAPGQLLGLSQEFVPPLIKGMTIYPENPLLFDFIVEPGNSHLRGAALNQEALKMVKYFLASLTIPDDQMWVNLSPYEKDRIISDGLRFTTMGQDLLAQDYVLKQMTSSLLYPENELGKKFWQKVYKIAYERFGTTQIPVETFNKVWVVPRRAAVYEHGNSVFVVSRDLKVMLEEDYLSRRKSLDKEGKKSATLNMNTPDVNDISSQIVREIIIPELEKEVNEGKYFAELRQIYNAMILAKWYKENLRETLLGKVYADQNKTKGIETPAPDITKKIYQQYLTVFRQGVYNFIKEEYDIGEKGIIPRKYFSGGLMGFRPDITIERNSSPITLEPDQKRQLPTESATKITIELADIGAGAQSSSAITAAVKEDQASLPSFQDVHLDGDVKNVVDKILAKENLVVDIAMEMMIHDFTVEQSDGTIDNSAEIGTGSGGLGFLEGETNTAFWRMVKSGAFSVIPKYKNFFNKKTGDYEPIKWENIPGVKPLMRKNVAGPERFRFSMSFKGNYNLNPLGTNYDVEIDYLIHKGNLVLLIDVPENPDIFHNLYDRRDGDKYKWIQFAFVARTLVEFMKTTGITSKVIRLNEGHMAFVYAAMRADIEFHRQRGTRSIFEGTSILYTTHTPEWAGIPNMNDINYLRQLVGDGVLPDYILTERADGSKYFNALLAVAQNIADKDNPIPILINTVSHEHREVTLRLLLNEVPGIEDYVIAIQNASDAEVWWSDDLIAAVAKYGLSGITKEMLFQFVEKNKRDINKELRRLYGENVQTFNNEFLKEWPLLAFARRFVEYKEAGVLLKLVKWITGDKDKNYERPAIHDFSQFNDEDILDKLAKAEWTTGPGLEMLMLVGGKAQGEPMGDSWHYAYNLLSQDPELKGRLVVIDDTGFDFMRLATTSCNAWYNVPDPGGREASGTSHMRTGQNGIINFMAIRAGFEPQAVHNYNAFFIDAFPGRTEEQLIDDFNPRDEVRIKKARKLYRERIPLLVTAYFTKFVEMHKNYKENKDDEYAEWMLRAFRMAYDTADIHRMIAEYDVAFTSLAEGSGKKGFEAKRESMYLQNLFVKVYRWNPELRQQEVTSARMKSEIEKVWAPLDALVLGKDRIKEIQALDGNDLEKFFVENGLEKKPSGSWQPAQEEFEPKYLEIGGKASSPVKEKEKVTEKVGGIDLNPSLLDLQIKRDDKGIPLPLLQQPIQDMNIDGFLPIIINITPVNLPLLLGGQAPETESDLKELGLTSHAGRERFAEL